jgi:cationic peptide transport system substrate-binding protein
MQPYLKKVQAVVACALLGACSYEQQTTINGLVYCSEANPVIFNPQLTTTGSTIDIISHQLYNRLLSIDPSSGKFIPELATSWYLADEGRKVVFNLRKDVPFHQTDFFTPTRLFNADDVVFSFSRLFDVYNPYHFVSGGTYPYFQSIGLDKSFRSVSKTGEHQVTFELFNADNSFLSNMATDFAVVLSAEYAKNLEKSDKLEHIDRLPIGTGPFKFRRFKRDAFVRFYRNDVYWQHDVEVEQLVFDITSDSNSRIAKALTGECDIVAHPSSAHIDALNSRSDIELEKLANLNVGFLAFNTQKPPFDKPQVRRAISHAIDKNKIIQAVYFNNASLAQSILPPESWAYQAQPNYPSYNLDLAKSLLGSVGLENGFTMDLWAMPVSRIYNPNATKMAELIQSELRKINIKVNIVEYEWNTFLERLSTHQHDSVLIGWTADSPEPDNFLNPILSCASQQSGENPANWCHPEFESLLKQAQNTHDTNTRREIFYSAQQLVAQELPLLPIAHGLRLQAKSTHISGIEVPPFGGISLAKVRKN